MLMLMSLEARCTACGNTGLKAMGPGNSTFVWEFVPSKFVRKEHVQEVLRCRCGGCIITAPGAPKVVEKGHYGASFLAHPEDAARLGGIEALVESRC